MHIGFLNPQGNFDPRDSYWTEHPDFGGQLVYVKEVAAAMARQGHTVDILTRQIIDPEWPEFAAPEDAYPGLEGVRILRFPCGPKTFLPKEELWPYLGPEWVPNILAFYREEGRLPDAFTTHYGDGGLAGALIARDTGQPFTFTGHSLGAQKMEKLQASRSNLPSLDLRFRFTYRISAERISMNHANRIITSTHQERLEQYGHRAYRGAVNPRQESRFAVIPPGVNRSIFSPKPTGLDQRMEDRIQAALHRDVGKARADYPLVLVSSRLDEKKNHIGAVRAFAESETLRETANLGIVVRGLENPLQEHTSLSPDETEIMEKMIALIKEHGLEQTVTSFPLNSQPELAAAYRVLQKNRSVFCLPALYEPFGLAPLEAMSCGLPAVVTQNGGPSESMIEGHQRFGVLVDPNDPEDIARGLLEATDTPAAWKELQQAGLNRVISTYTWERTAERYLNVLQDILAEPAPPRNVELPPYFEDPHPENELPLEILMDLYFPEEAPGY
jgi:sucrose-phosphate synthase